MERITLRDIAERVGLSHVTVSLALRDHPSLPERTKEKVRKMAAELGYRRDPVLDALVAYRHANRGFKYQATLAWIIPATPGLSNYFLQTFEGTKKSAETLGFHLEPFWVQTSDDWKRFDRTLKSRRIEGLLLPPPLLNWNPDDPLDQPWTGFPWEDFSAIAVGEIAGPPLHLVVNNQFQSAARAVRELHALGYRKIGIALPTLFAKRTGFLFIGGYLAECVRLKLPPLFLLDDTLGCLLSKEVASRWIARHRPDAIIASGHGDILPVLREAKLRTPDDIAVAVLSISAQHPELAGIDQNFRLIGEEAVNHLVDLIRRNERGIPAFPMRYLVEGTWVDGPSAPPKSRSAM